MSKKVILLILAAIISIFAICLLAFLVWFPISPLNTTFNFFISSPKQIIGSVYNCETNEPVENAKVEMFGTGWGWKNGPVWNKGYYSKTQTNKEGRFNLTYKIGTKLSVAKKGYLQALEYTSPKENVRIGIIEKTEENKTEIATYNCKLSSECNKEVIVNGKTVFWNSCTNPELDKEYKDYLVE